MTPETDFTKPTAWARRAAKGDYASRLSRLPFEWLNPLDFDQTGGLSRESVYGLMSFIAGDLWRNLTAAYGKCDCMVPGKYRKARVFAFETPNFYIWCDTESGDRGTSWQMAAKSSEPQEKRPCGYYAQWKGREAALAETIAFFKGLCCGMAAADEEALNELERFEPGWAAGVRAAAEAAELCACAAKPSAAKSKRAI